MLIKFAWLPLLAANVAAWILEINALVMSAVGAVIVVLLFVGDKLIDRRRRARSESLTAREGS